MITHPRLCLWVHLEQRGKSMGAIGGIARPSGTLVPRGLSHSGESVGTPRTGQAAARGRQDDEVEDQSVGKARQNHAARGSELRHFAAGGCGGMMGALLTCPLEVVKTHLQSKAVLQRSIDVVQIARADGVVGFWRGIGPMLAGVVPARAVNFWTYNAVKGGCCRPATRMGPPYMAGIVGGTVTVTVVNRSGSLRPACSFRGRVRGGHWPGVSWVASCVSSDLQEEGVRVLQGVDPQHLGCLRRPSSLLFMSASSMLMCATNTGGVREDNSPRGRQAGDKPELRNQSMSGLQRRQRWWRLSQRTRTRSSARLRERGASESTSRQCIVCAKYADEGMRGLYGGLFTHLLRVVPNTAILSSLTRRFQVPRHSLVALDPARRGSMLWKPQLAAD